MSVLIKGMKKPDNCEACPYAFCHLDTRNCPIIELPDHEDLIGRETLMYEIADWQLSESPEEGKNWWLGKDVTSHEMQYCIYRLLGDVYEEVRDIPAVIPAERRGR